MIPRLIAALSVGGGFIAVVLLDPSQFGYPYMGLLAGVGAFFRLIGAESLVLMLIIPVLCILITIAFGSWIVLTMVVLSIRVVTVSPTRLLRVATLFSTLILSLTLLAGLALLRSYPGLQEIPLSFSDTYFVYPLLLALAACLFHFIDNKV